VRPLFLLAGLLSVASAAADGALAAPTDPLVDHARSALVDRFLGDQRGMESTLAAVRDIDAARARDDRDETGLADQLLYLRNSALPSRDEYLRELRRSLGDDPDPYLAGRIRWAIKSDEVVTAGRLLGAARRNRVAKLVNDAARPLGRLTSIALSGLNPALALTATVDSITATGGNLWHWARPTAEEREALHRYRQYARRDPAPADAPSAARMHRIAERVADVDCDRALRRARVAAATEPATARAHLEAARLIPGCEPRATEDLGQVDTRSPTPADARLWPLDPLPPIAESVAPAYYGMLLALVRAEPAEIQAGARALRVADGDGDLGDEARYAETVAADLEGRHEDALAALRTLADDDSSTNMGRQAQELLQRPDTDRFATLRSEVAAHRWARVRYVLIGENRKPLATAHGLARAGLRGLQGLQNLGLFNVFGLVGRCVHIWRGDPVSNARIIAAGEDLLERDPQSPHAAETREALADAYVRSGEYERALFHLARMEVPGEERMEEVRSRAAARLLRVAQDDAFGPLARRRALGLLVDHYPETTSAEKARRLLDEQAAVGQLALPASMLRTDPTLAPRLGVPPAWVDGHADNGELADREIRLADGDRLVAPVEMGDRSTEQTLPLDAEQLAAFTAVASETHYLAAARDADGNHAGAPFERFIPFFIEGSVGASGISLVPGLKPSSVQSEQRQLYDEN